MLFKPKNKGTPQKKTEPQNSYEKKFAKQRTFRMEWLNHDLEKIPNSNPSEESIRKELLENQTPKDEPHDINNMAAELERVKAELWQMQLKYLGGREFLNVVSPTLQKVYWFAYRKGYQTAENNDFSDITPDGFDKKTADIYQKGLSDGYRFWHWMWIGM